MTASGDGTAKVWDATTGAEVLTLKGHTGCGRFGVVQPGRVADRDREWGRDGEGVGRDDGGRGPHPQGAHEHVSSASFSPDGSRIVTASEDGTAKVWDARPFSPVKDGGGEQAENHAMGLSRQVGSLAVVGGTRSKTSIPLRPPLAELEKPMEVQTKPPPASWSQGADGGSLPVTPDYVIAYRYGIDDPRGTFKPTIYNSHNGQYTAEVRAALDRWVDDIARNHPRFRAAVELVSVSVGAEGYAERAAGAGRGNRPPEGKTAGTQAVPLPGTDPRRAPRRDMTAIRGEPSKANEQTKESMGAESLAGTTWFERIPRNYGNHLTVWIYYRGADATSGAFTMLEGYSIYDEFWPTRESGRWRQEGNTLFMDYTKVNGRRGPVRSKGTIGGDVIEGRSSLAGGFEWSWTQTRRTSKDRLPEIDSRAPASP